MCWREDSTILVVLPCDKCEDALAFVCLYFPGQKKFAVCLHFPMWVRVSPGTAAARAELLLFYGVPRSVARQKARQMATRLGRIFSPALGRASPHYAEILCGGFPDLTGYIWTLAILRGSVINSPVSIINNAITRHRGNSQGLGAGTPS